MKQSGEIGKANNRTTVNNFNLSNANSIAKRHFSDKVHKVEHAGDRFDLYVYDSVDMDELDYFAGKYPEFNIFLVWVTEYKKQSKK